MSTIGWGNSPWGYNWGGDDELRVGSIAVVSAQLKAIDALTAALKQITLASAQLTLGVAAPRITFQQITAAPALRVAALTNEATQ